MSLADLQRAAEHNARVTGEIWHVMQGRYLSSLAAADSSGLARKLARGDVIVYSATPAQPSNA